MPELNPKDYESKWLDHWDETQLYKTDDTSDKEPFYVLEMFPYPSGNLHMGHVRNYSIGDCYGRFKRMSGYNVLHPMGFDSFGLPAENAAIKHKLDPAEWTDANIESMVKQFRSIGLGYDWDRTLATSHPDYYKWNQWIFIKMVEKGLIYRKNGFVNWDPVDQTVLANEQVIDGKGWRSGAVVEQKEIEQWYIKITDYAEELLNGLDSLTGWPEAVRLMQKNWIGRSEGVEIKFRLQDENEHITVFTTCPHTVYGITYVVVAPEYPSVQDWVKGTDYEASVSAYIEAAKNKSQEERTDETKPKEGVFTGKYIISPFTGETYPIYISDYVLVTYGTGAVMAVPAHDQRDFEFAKTNNLPIKVVIQPENVELTPDTMTEAFTEHGTMVGSGKYNDMNSADFKKKIADVIEEKKIGRKTVNYRLRDWLISRQRYWGTPIPFLYDEEGNAHPEDIENLPIELPKDVTFGQGNPLDSSPSFAKVEKNGKTYRRETDTMDTFFDSSWYFYRYCDPKNTNLPFDQKTVHPWLPVHQYIGGIEHACMHLLYARFFTKVFRDLGLADLDEPFTNLMTQGMVIKDGAKMSKSLGNTVDPNAIIDKYGADTARLFILFGAPVDRDLDWSDKGVEGCYRFLARVYRLCTELENHPLKEGKASELEKSVHKTIKNVTKDIDRFQFNTSISRMMELVNEMYQIGATQEALEKLLQLLSPFAPLMTEECWSLFGHQSSIHLEAWPSYDDAKTIDETVTIVVQINGKVRDKLELSRDLDQETVENAAKESEKIQKYLEDGTLFKVIYVPNKLLNMVVK